MSETKTYVFGEGGNSQNGFDPNLMWASMMNGGGFGGGMNYLWPFFLLFLWGRGGFGGWGNNGNGCGNGYEFLSSQINNSTGRELLMQAINGNGNAIGQLANNFNCGIGDIQNCGVEGRHRVENRGPFSGSQRRRREPGRLRFNANFT